MVLTRFVPGLQVSSAKVEGHWTTLWQDWAPELVVQLYPLLSGQTFLISVALDRRRECHACLGQHPTAVSPASIEYSTSQPKAAVWFAMAEQALV
jgi:hypothetical protein